MLFKKRLIPLILIFALLALPLASCKKNGANEKTLDDTFMKYRADGLSSWVDVAAMYNGFENPIDYKNFDNVAAGYADSGSPAAMARYLLIAGIAVNIGANTDSFEYYEEFKTKLVPVFDNFNAPETIETYVIAYAALKSAKAEFSDQGFISYLNEIRKDDGSYHSKNETDPHDPDTTARLMPLLTVLAPGDSGIGGSIYATMAYLDGLADEDGAYKGAAGTPSLTSTALALSAKIAFNSYMQNGQTVNANSAFKPFKDEAQPFYKETPDGGEDQQATSYALLTLYDARENTTFWQTFINPPAETETAADDSEEVSEEISE